jgi:hypothetical protein
MISEVYALEADNSQTEFSFVSEGKNGSICKIVSFVEYEHLPGVYNLGFGDLDGENSHADDLARSNNGDMEKVLSTVAMAVILFTENNKDATIYAEGSTLARTRLYRFMISRFWKMASELFEVKGCHPETGWEAFKPNQPYEAFIAKRCPEKP